MASSAFNKKFPLERAWPTEDDDGGAANTNVCRTEKTCRKGPIVSEEVFGHVKWRKMIEKE